MSLRSLFNVNRIRTDFLKNQRGIGLVEVIISLGIAVVIVTSMVSLAVFTLRSTTQNELMIQGTRLADQQIERVRAYRDVIVADYGWEYFYNSLVDGAGNSYCAHNCTSSSTCYIDSNFNARTGVPPFNESNAGKIRTCYYPQAVPGDPNVVDIIVVSTWEFSGETKYARNYTRLSNWRY
jgi:type II secretory pathway pseudopilin PulG